MASSDLEAGVRVIAGRYRLGRALGRGGMGVVWAGHDELLARPVAVKEVRLPGSLDPDEREVLRERAMREARTAARLDHPCAVRVFDVCEADETAFIVMELIEGRTLADLIRAEGPISPARAAEIGGCLLDALDAAHAAGIVHRDVKPGNVLVRPDGRVTLTDFGIASTAGDPSITSTGLLLGSPAYIAPERARGRTPEPPSDLWSLGATLYTAVEGRPPFDHPDPVATLTSVVTDEPAPCVLAGPVLGDALIRLLAKDPAQRPDPGELRSLLRVAAATPGDAAPVPPPRPVAVRTAGETVALRLGEAGEALAEPSLRARVGAWLVMCLVLFVVAGAATALTKIG